MVTGDAHLRVSADIRITGIKMLEVVWKGYETYTPEYYKDETKMFTTLPDVDSTVVYEVEITNFSNQTYLLKEITETMNSNKNIEYVIEKIKIGSEIAANDKVTFTIKVHYADDREDIPSDITSIIDLNYEFELPDTTPPTVTFSVTGGVYNATKEVTITVTDSNYSHMNIQVNDSNGIVLQQDGITADSYTVTLGHESTWTIYVRAYDKAGNMQETAPLNQYNWTYQTYIITASCQRVSSCGCETLGAWQTSGSSYTRTYDASTTGYMNKTVCTATSPTSTDYTCQNYVRYCLQYICC